MTDPRFWRVREALATYAGDADDPPPRSGEALRAAVSLVLRGREELDLLLIKRAHAPRDPWSGHMALPGGRQDPSDRDLLDTAVRETQEETGVRLDRTGVHLGRMDVVAPESARLPRITIAPFVFGVPALTPARANSPEVDAVLWVPLDALRDPALTGRVRIPLGADSRDFPCFRVQGQVVWGLTYRILTRFLEALPAAPPSPR